MKRRKHLEPGGGSAARLKGQFMNRGIEMKALIVAVASGICLLAGMTAMAHHSFATQYDSSKAITLEGVVTKVEWMNPHARFYMDVKDPNGQTANWNLELASPNVLKRNGWSSKSLQIGDHVKVEGSVARDGSKMANARVVTLPTGQRVFARAAADAK
jgi:hypothetical protein